jgi:hypothetical protein
MPGDEQANRPVDRIVVRRIRVSRCGFDANGLAASTLDGTARIEQLTWVPVCINPSASPRLDRAVMTEAR